MLRNAMKDQSSVNDNLRKLLDCIFEEHRMSDMDCETCGSQFTCLVEMVARGANLHELMPAVEAHLACCPECNEEYQALLCIIRAEMNGTLINNNQG